MELLRLSNGVTLVSGKHYEAGILGVYIAPGCRIPGWLAEDLWLVKKGDEPYLIEPRPIRGVDSPGVFAGSSYRNSPASSWQAWPMWRKRFAVGDDLAGYLGIAVGFDASKQDVSFAHLAEE